MAFQIPVPVQSLVRHSRADIALLRIHSQAASGVEPFTDCVTNYAWGEEFMAFGYPEDIFGPSGRRPTPRAFAGHYQRYMTFKSHLGYEYNAAEMSIPAPAGLSGGPVFRPEALMMVTGVATENLESSTTLDAVEEVQEDGASTRTVYQKIITYGVALLLDSHAAWLQDNGVTKA